MPGTAGCLASPAPALSAGKQRILAALHCQEWDAGADRTTAAVWSSCGGQRRQLTVSSSLRRTIQPGQIITKPIIPIVAKDYLIFVNLLITDGQWPAISRIAFSTKTLELIQFLLNILQTKMVNFLLARNSNPESEDKNGRKAVDIAQHRDTVHCHSFLQVTRK